MTERTDSLRRASRTGRLQHFLCSFDQGRDKRRRISFDLEGVLVAELEDASNEVFLLEAEDETSAALLLPSDKTIQEPCPSHWESVWKPRHLTQPRPCKEGQRSSDDVATWKGKPAGLLAALLCHHHAAVNLDRISVQRRQEHAHDTRLDPHVEALSGRTRVRGCDSCSSTSISPPVCLHCLLKHRGDAGQPEQLRGSGKRRRTERATASGPCAHKR